MRSVLRTESAVGSATTSCPRAAPRVFVSVCGALRSNVGGAWPPQAESAQASASDARPRIPQEARPTSLTSIPLRFCGPAALHSTPAAVLRHRPRRPAAAEDDPLRIAVQIFDGAVEIGKRA